MTSKRTGGRSISLMGAISATAKRPRDRETKRRGDQSATERPGGAINLLLRDQTGGEISVGDSEPLLSFNCDFGEIFK